MHVRLTPAAGAAYVGLDHQQHPHPWPEAAACSSAEQETAIHPRHAQQDIQYLIGQPKL